MTLGQKIKTLRVEKRITQKELADQLNVTFQTVSKWENDENEPDVATLRSLAKIFNCSLDDLLNDEEGNNENNPEIVEEAVIVETPKEVVKETVVIHKEALHTCQRCKKEIPEDELIVQNVKVAHGRDGLPDSYKPVYYHKKCLLEVQKQAKKNAEIAKHLKGRHNAKMSWIWSTVAGVVSLVAFLLVFLLVPYFKETLNPGMAVLYSFLLGYGFFSGVYTIITGSYVADVFGWCVSRSIKFPMLIFTWDIEGFIWVIAMKVLFAILGFLFGVVTFFLGIALGLILGAVSFPFVVVYNNRIDYDNYLPD